MIPEHKVRITGGLYLLTLIAGVFSVAPAADAAAYLTKAAAHETEVIVAAIFQLVISFAYLSVAVLIYPLVKIYGRSLAIGFLSSRIVAVTLSLLAVVALLLVVALSKIYLQNPNPDVFALQAMGNIIKTARDLMNHVLMIMVLCAGNFPLYFLLVKAKFIPRWLSVWGVAANTLSIFASVLILFQAADIMTPTYLLLNAPTAFQELVLGIWLIIKGARPPKEYTV